MALSSPTPNVVHSAAIPRIRPYPSAAYPAFSSLVHPVQRTVGWWVTWSSIARL